MALQKVKQDQAVQRLQEMEAEEQRKKKLADELAAQKQKILAQKQRMQAAAAKASDSGAEKKSAVSRFFQEDDDEEEESRPDLSKVPKRYLGIAKPSAAAAPTPAPVAVAAPAPPPSSSSSSSSYSGSSSSGPAPKRSRFSEGPSSAPPPPPRAAAAPVQQPASSTSSSDSSDSLAMMQAYMQRMAQRSAPSSSSSSSSSSSTATATASSSAPSSSLKRKDPPAPAPGDDDDDGPIRFGDDDIEGPGTGRRRGPPEDDSLSFVSSATAGDDDSGPVVHGRLKRGVGGRHHIGDYLPQEEMAKFMARARGDKIDEGDYDPNKLKDDNIGHKMLKKMGWSEGQGLGRGNQGAANPVRAAPQRIVAAGIGAVKEMQVEASDDPFLAYKKRMALSYKFRPNPLGNQRTPYWEDPDMNKNATNSLGGV